MHHTDLGHRALCTGCGAALFNLRVAAAHAAITAQVRLLPEPADPLLPAAVRLRASAAPEPDGRTLLVDTAHGVRTSMLHRAMERRDLREVMRDPAAEQGAIRNC